MAGPGKMWAFVKWAHVAMRRGPRLYWDWTVSFGRETVSSISRRAYNRLTANITEFPVLED